MQDSSAPRPSLGKYRVVRLLGEGSMGMVFLAHDPTLERDVAIKVMSGSAVHDPRQRERFEREAKAVAKLHHPNIVTVHDLGYDAYESPFIAMELLEGADLHDLTTTAKLALGAKLQILLQVCRGLAHAHEAGIVHRDIKPANIFVLRDGTAKIMDFGVSRWLSTQKTQAGLVVGTAGYISPEQLRGKAVDGRADLFSLGVVLYEALTHEVLYGGDSIETIFFKTLGREVPRLVMPDGKELPALQSVLERALAKEVGARYRSAREMEEGLEAFMATHRALLGETFVFATRERPAVSSPSASPPRPKAPTRVVPVVPLRPRVVRARPTAKKNVPARSRRWPLALTMGVAVTVVASALGIYSLVVERPVTSSADASPPETTHVVEPAPAPPGEPHTESAPDPSPELQADAALAIARGDVEEARRLIERGEQLDPDAARWKTLREQLQVLDVEAGRKALSSKKVDEARRYLERGDSRKAIAAYTEALTYDPKNADARRGLDRAVADAARPTVARKSESPRAEASVGGGVAVGSGPRQFVEERTVFTPGRSTDRDLMGFEAEPGFEVGETTDAFFPAQIILELDPSDAKPGDPYVVKVSLFNEGYRPIRLAGLELTSRFGDRTAGKGQPLPLSVNEIPPQTTVLLHEIRGTWKEALNEGALEATVTLDDGATLKKTLRW